VAELGERDEALLKEAAEAARYVWDGTRRAGILCDLAARTNPASAAVLDAIFAQALAVASLEHRAEVFGALAAKSGSEMLARLAELTMGLADQPGAPAFLRAVASRWGELCAIRKADPADELGLWLSRLSRTRRPHLLNCLAALMPAIAAVGGTPGVLDTARAIEDAARSWR
jgi:hypothetical protein